MSYILDALTKSQKERRNGGASGLAPPRLVPGPTAGARKRTGAGVLVFLGLVSVLLAALFAQRDQEVRVARPAPDATRGSSPGASLPPAALDPAPAVAQADASAAPERHSTGDVADAPEVAALPRRPAAAASAGDAGPLNAPIAIPPWLETAARHTRAEQPSEATVLDTSPRGDSSRAVSEDEAALRAAEERLFGRDAGDDVVHPATTRLVEDLRALAGRPAAPPNPAPVVPGEPALSDVLLDSAAPRAIATLPAPGATPPAPSAPSRSRREPPRWARQLPAELRASLGELTLNAHVYTDDPAKRLVIINMKRYYEGEVLREGPRVETITERGAILSYRSHRFLLDSR